MREMAAHRRTIPLFITVLVLHVFASSQPSRALEIGGGYNEQIANLDNGTLMRSGARWVRAYVNLSRNFVTYGQLSNPAPNPPPNPFIFPIDGVIEGNLIQDSDHVSTDADVLAIAALDKLIYTKSVLVRGEPLKVILSLKHDFTYPYPVTPHAPPDQQGRVPDPGTPSGAAELENMIKAVEDLLTTNSRGQYIDILVLGNEPMFEVQPNNSPTTAGYYATYLNLLADRVAALRASPPDNAPPWTFEIYVGALNQPSRPAPADNTIIGAVLDVAASNPNVAGVDLHEHMSSSPEELETDLQQDINYVLERIRADQNLICTEFSVIGVLSANQTDTLGKWGVLNGYGKNSESMPMWSWINEIIKETAAGKPIGPGKFMSFFNSRPWYPKRWFSRMIETFALPQNRVVAVTYGLEQLSRYPSDSNNLDGSATPWILNPVYNATLFGSFGDGRLRTNPMVSPEFEQAARRHNK